VSGRVVNTRQFAGGAGRADQAEREARPSERPIQFDCISLTFSGQRSSRLQRVQQVLESSVMLEEPLRQLALLDSAPERQPLPSITCSLASTVMSTGSQLTLADLRSTSPALPEVEEQLLLVL
jgi:hypothetical protein